MGFRVDDPNKPKKIDQLQGLEQTIDQNQGQTLGEGTQRRLDVQKRVTDARKQAIDTAKPVDFQKPVIETPKIEQPKDNADYFAKAGYGSAALQKFQDDRNKSIADYSTNKSKVINDAYSNYQQQLNKMPVLGVGVIGTLSSFEQNAQKAAQAVAQSQGNPQAGLASLGLSSDALSGAILGQDISQAGEQAQQASQEDQRTQGVSALATQRYLNSLDKTKKDLVKNQQSDVSGLEAETNQLTKDFDLTNQIETAKKYSDPVLAAQAKAKEVQKNLEKSIASPDLSSKAAIESYRDSISQANYGNGTKAAKDNPDYIKARDTYNNKVVDDKLGAYLKQTGIADRIKKGSLTTAKARENLMNELMLGNQLIR